jgi:TatA/E family protein of Tat protein translocase
MFNANPVELIIIGVLLIIFFGQDKLASTAKNLGQSFRVFKKELSLEESSPKAQTANSSEIKTETKAVESSTVQSVEAKI